LFTNYDDLLDPVQHEIYFPDDLLTLRRDEVFVDCGAFDGDTIRRYLARQRAFGRIKAFEADPANFKKLESYIAKLPEHQRIRIDAYPYAVSSRTQVLSFAATGNEAASVRSGAGSVPVQGRPLDQVLADCCPTYLKMDIEGSESEGLRGAKRIVQTQQPALAVCVYHRQRHLWELPSLVRSFTDDYVYYLRPHVLECWDTVCYAIPRGRVQGPLS
jgi:FkbM family methyltransferase